MNCYTIGGLNIGIDAPPYKEEAYLAAFRTEGCHRLDLRLTVRIAQDLRFPSDLHFSAMNAAEALDEKGVLTRYGRRELTKEPLYRISERSTTELEASISPFCAEILSGKMLLSFLALPQRFLQMHSVILHASYILLDGKAILFTAPSQTGKSTQAALWQMHRGALTVNGDRALLRKIDGRWNAEGTPFCGSSKTCLNRTAPIRAVVGLQQGTENRIARATQRETVLAFLSGCDYDHTSSEAVNTILELAEEISAAIPIFTFSCLPDVSAVECLEQALEKETIHVR